MSVSAESASRAIPPAAHSTAAPRALTVAQQTDTSCFPTTQAQADADQCTDINPLAIPTTLAYQISNSLGSDQMNYVIGDELLCGDLSKSKTRAQAAKAVAERIVWLKNKI